MRRQDISSHVPSQDLWFRSRQFARYFPLKTLRTIAETPKIRKIWRIDWIIPTYAVDWRANRAIWILPSLLQTQAPGVAQSNHKGSFPRFDRKMGSPFRRLPALCFWRHPAYVVSLYLTDCDSSRFYFILYEVDSPLKLRFERFVIKYK